MGYGVRVVSRVADDDGHAVGHGVEEHVVACENSDDTVAVVAAAVFAAADTGVAIDDYCSFHILDDVVGNPVADNLDQLDRVVVNGDRTDDDVVADTFGVVAGTDAGDSLPQL